MAERLLIKHSFIKLSELITFVAEEFLKFYPVLIYPILTIEFRQSNLAVVLSYFQVTAAGLFIAVLSASGSVDFGFDSESGQTNDFKIGIHSFPA